MKTTTSIIAIPLLLTSLYAEDILNITQKNIFESKQKKATLEADLTKDSWINPLYIEGEVSKSKNSMQFGDINSKKASIVFNQEIFKSGGIFDTIEKGKLESTLNHIVVSQEKKILLSSIYENVLSLQKIDLQIKKLHYLISNKKIEIDRNKALYVNGLLEITILDESLIELNSLKNQKIALNMNKVEVLKEFQQYTEVNYTDVDLSFLSFINFKEFIQNNKDIKLKKLSKKEKELSQNIIESDYLPTVSIYGNYGYEDNNLPTKDDDYHNYGLKISMPIDYNSHKNKELATLNTLIAIDELQETTLYQEEFHHYIMNSLNFINEKITVVNLTLDSYTSLYETVFSLYKNSLKTIEDVHIVQNRLESSKLDKLILGLDKKMLLNKLYSKI